ncbi:MAG: hypothetical protein MI919_16650, partial [Holophagales bacterium]|nr:hypothetical protein [Holophagales bacterium]
MNLLPTLPLRRLARGRGSSILSRMAMRISARAVAVTILCISATLVPAPAEAAVLDDDNQITVTLGDGTSVVLFGEAGRSGRKTRNYYYLPAQLRLAQRPDRTPEFLFLKFTTEDRADAGGTSGALLHFLMTWGLTAEQESELESKLKERSRGARLRGAVPLEEGEEGGSFRIISATLSDDEMTRSLVTSGRAPLVPGGKAAAAARLDENGAQLMAASFERTRSIADLSIALDFKYSTLTPAARGSIVFDWQKWEREYEKLEADYAKWVSGKREKKFLGITYSTRPLYSYSYDEMHAHYEYLFEKQIVRLEFEELVADERVSKIREAFFQYFLDTFTQTTQDEVPPPPGEDEAKQVPNIRHGQRYGYKQVFDKRSFSRKVMRFDLSYRMSIKRPFQLVGNLASWYDHVKDNPKCVGSVNLNDPFFEHRDIHLVLDLDAKEIFDDVINYVTVNVRKRRSQGRDFETSVTLDKAHLAESGIRASVTYARGEDRNPDAYQYAVQWSLRGGHVVPERPDWQDGDWQGVTLTPPVEARLFEVEGDLGEMEDSDITRATVQIRYRQFGEEKEANVHLSPSRGEPLME